MNNSSQNVVKTTETEQGSNSGELITAEEIAFINLVAKGVNPTTAYRQSHPVKSGLSYSYVRKLTMGLLQRLDIAKEIETAKETKARLARLSEDRIEEILTEVKPNRIVADVALAMYEHANGKATQRVEVQSRKVSVNIDLTGVVTDDNASEHRGARTPA